MTDTSIIQTVINVNAPKVDYLTDFVERMERDPRPFLPAGWTVADNGDFVRTQDLPQSTPEPPQWLDVPDNRRARVTAFQHWTGTPEFMARLREATQEKYGNSRSAIGMQKTLAALAAKAAKHNSFTFRYPGTRTIATETAQSHVAVARHLERLEDLGLISILKNETAWKVQIAESLQFIDAAGGNSAVDPAKDILLTFSNLGDDIFAVGGAYNYATARRLGDTVLLRSAGPAARLVWNALHDATLSGSELVELTGLSAGSVRGALQRLLELRLIDVNRGSHGKHTYSLIEDAQERLDDIRTNTTTYANTQRRLELYARERARDLDFRLRAADTEAEKEKLKAGIRAQVNKAWQYRNALEDMGIKPAGKAFQFDVDRENSSEARHERQRQRDKRDLQADLRAMAEMVKELPREDAKRQLSYAGYSDIETARILSYRMVVNDYGGTA